MDDPSILVNGQPSQQVNLKDRGFFYGDGIFRTLLAVNGQPIQWALHYEKIIFDCKALGIPCPDHSQLLAEVLQTAPLYPRAAIKVVITRGEGPRGYGPPLSVKPTRVVMCEPLPKREIPLEGITVRKCEIRVSEQPLLAGIKHLNRLENVLARAEWHDPAIHEGLMLDQALNVISGTMSNLFIIEGHHLLTPDLSRTGVAGVTRERVIALSEQLDLKISVDQLSFDRVASADAIFFVNSLIGCWPVGQLEEKRFPAHEKVVKIKALLGRDDA